LDSLPHYRTARGNTGAAAADVFRKSLKSLAESLDVSAR